MQIQRLRLKINGVERPVLCDMEKDSLATVLRRTGYTGVKVGCGTGVCGACSVIVNGEVIRSCTRKMKAVKEDSEIITIEGIGTPQHMHPLQQAWVTFGGAQCGFCSPGFIVSAYGLLQNNTNPSRTEVRAWFQKHRNICRCTGYKPLVDAVMAAAEVMRGEKTMDDITYQHDGGDYYGSKMPRPTAIPKVTGLTDYGDDIALKAPEGVAHLAVVISKEIHANIINIDISEAEKAPGVIKVMLADDVKGTNNMAVPAVVVRQKGKGITEFPVIAGKKINRRGDVVALVAADTRENARAAALLVKQELEILPAYKTLPEAAMPTAIQLYPDIPNIYMEAPVFKGEVSDESFETADFAVTGSFHSQHEPHLPIESDITMAYIDAEGRMTVQSKSQALTECKDDIAMACGIAPDQVRMIQNPAGGSFGYAITANIMCLAVTGAQNLGIPCNLSLSYDEFNHMSGKRSATYTNGKLACDKDGYITAAEYDIGLDHGAYAVVAGKIFENLVSIGFHGYNIPAIRALARGGSSNNAFNTAYRGFGAPQVYTATEALVDMLARKAGIDPFDFRVKNVASEGHTSINSAPYYEYVYPQLLEMAKPYYDQYKAEANAANAADNGSKKLGVGVSMGGFLCTIGMFDSCDVALGINEDGTFTHYNTWQDVGQGGDIGALTHTLKALEVLNLKPEDVRLVMNDNAVCPDTGVSAASRSHYMAGKATLDAAEKLLGAMKKADGTYRTYAEMVAEGLATRYEGHYDQANIGLPPGISPNNGMGEKNAAYMYAVNVCQVEVDVATGKTTVLKYTCASDVGKIGNRLSVEGQAYGGLSHSIGFALTEDYDMLDKHGNIAGCGVPQVTDVPDEMTLLFLETPRANGPHGSAGCSECYQSSGHMAVINAIDDACGARVYALPATPDKVKDAYERVQKGEDLTPPAYFLGNDLEEELDRILANPIG